MERPRFGNDWPSQTLVQTIMKEYKYTINGNKYAVTIDGVEGNVANVTVNGELYKVEMEKEAAPEKPKVKIVPPTEQKPAAADDKPAAARASYQNAVKAPLPGVITEITVAVGDEVKAGDTVVVLEAMKMANNLEAEKGGKVSAILVQPGQSVMEGDVLVAID